MVRPNEFVCKRCGAHHSGTYSPTLCSDCYNKSH